MKIEYFKLFPFRKKLPRKRHFFKFLNPFYFPLGCGANLILGTFWDIPVNFLKNVIWQLWATYRWSNTRLKAVSSTVFCSSLGQIFKSQGKKSHPFTCNFWQFWTIFNHKKSTIGINTFTLTLNKNAILIYIYF